MPPSASEHERRALPRQEVSYRLDVIAPGGNAGCLLDLSVSGMRVRFRSEIDVAGTQRLNVAFPRWLELGAGVQVGGRFVWMRTTKDGSIEGGFAFDGLSRKDAGLIQILIQRLAEALAEDRLTPVAA